MLVGYADTHNRAIRGRRCDMSDDGGVVFHPSGSVVQVNVQRAEWSGVRTHACSYSFAFALLTILMWHVSILYALSG